MKQKEFFLPSDNMKIIRYVAVRKSCQIYVVRQAMFYLLSPTTFLLFESLAGGKYSFPASSKSRLPAIALRMSSAREENMSSRE